MDETRIKGQEVDISSDSVKSFFDKRGHRYSQDDSNPEKSKDRYVLILFQDDNPELALERDRYEKALIDKLVEFKPGTDILDIGCGVGRWADYFRNKDIRQCIGVDFSDELIKIAKDLFKEDSRFCFSQGAFQELPDVIARNKYPSKYDYIFINGVFMYINDADLEICFKNLVDVLKAGSTIYLKDSVGIQSRFTLKDFESKELKSEYNAIYRSLDEWRKLFDKYLPESEYSVIQSDVLFKDEMKNRKETTDYYWIIRKNN